MGNSVTRSRKKKVPVVQTKRDSPFREEILTTRTGRQDFSTAQTLTGDIPSVEDILEPQPLTEDIIIKCNLEQMIKGFFQDYAIVWHDPNVNSQENQQYIAQLKRFCDVFTFTEWQKAKDFIQTTSAACHVVTSGTNGELLVKEVDQLQSVTNIYIFCGNKDYHSSWAKNYSKVSCIETNIEKVLSQIQSNLLEWYKQASSLKLNLPAFAPVFNETDKSQMNNLHRFLKVIPNFQNRQQAKNDFVDISKAIYSDPQNVKLIADFEQNYNTYDRKQTLKWYSQESFLYKVTNNCLRIATSDSIQYCRLLLQDIQQAIKEQYQTKSKNFNGLLYRGAYLSETEWSSLKANVNREIEMHGFLSVSKVKNVGLNFMKVDPSKKALITIIVPKGPNEEEQGFAEMQEFSLFPQEKEILFNARSRFTILETEDEPYRHLVLLYGAQGFRKYMTEQAPILEISIPSQKNISCSQCKVPRSDKIFFISLIDPQKQIYYCKECIDSQFAPFLWIPPTKKDKVKIQGFLLINSHNFDIPFYGYNCSKCQATKQKQYFTCTDCNQKWCQSCFEDSHNCTHNIILETSPFTFWYAQMSANEYNHIKFQSDLLASNNPLFQQAEMYFESQLYEKAIKVYSLLIQQNKEDIILAVCFNNLGLVFQTQGEYSKALEYYLKSLDTYKSISGDNHTAIANIYSNIGCIYDSQGEYTKALESLFQSLEISKSLSEMFTCYNNIGMVSHHKGEYTKALEYYEKSLDIAKSVYGDSHPEIATFLHNIAKVYDDQGEYNKALEYYEKSLYIAKSVYGDRHPDIARVWNKMGQVYFRQAEHKKALEYFFKSASIYKSVGGDNQPDLAIVYSNIGGVYDDQGEYKKALEYYEKSLEISKLAYGENHPTTATSLNNIGLAFFHQAEYQKALEYYLKSLEINKSVYGDNHPDLALSFNNIGLTFFQQAEYKKALEYFFIALGISKSVYDDYHPEIATTYNNIGLALFRQGEYQKALESYLKSLDIFRFVYGEDHPGIATSYNNVGLALFHQGDYTKALEYYFKSLDIYKAFYGDSHLDLATCYQNIGLVYNQQGEYQKALEYYLKSLDIAKSICGENHPTTGTFYNNIGFLYYNQGEDEKALECYFKSLDISKSVYGDDHPEIATVYQNIGQVYDHKKEYQKALEYYLKSLNIGKLAYGEKHALVATSYNNIGLLYFKQQEYKKALEYFLKALDSYKAVYGDSHPDVATSYQNIGLVYHQQGEYKKALEYLALCLEIQKSLYGDNNSKTIFTQKRISEIQSIGSTRSAEPSSISGK